MNYITRVSFAAIVVGALITACLMIFSMYIGSSIADHLITEALLFACIALGWLVGTAISPDNEAEGQKFSQLGKTVSVFASGYLVSKTDKLIEEVFKPATLLTNTDPLPAFRLTAAFAVFLITVAVTYTVRVYRIQLQNNSVNTPT